MEITNFLTRALNIALIALAANTGCNRVVLSPSWQEFEPIRRTFISNGWAGNTINTAPFRHHALLTVNGIQYGSFYGDDGLLKVFERSLSSGQVKLHEIHGSHDPTDSHNSASLGMDTKGYLHISYGQHSTRLRYRRSTRPFSIDHWTRPLAMSGYMEDAVTYPTFLMYDDNSYAPDLQFLYRDGRSGNGQACIKEYDADAQDWSDIMPCPFSGLDQLPWSSSPYWNTPAIHSDGTIHLGLTWRTHSLGEGELVNNIDIGYAYSTDFGETWFSSNRRHFRLPITPVNRETIFPVSPGNNLINQSGAAVDTQGRPHFVFYSNDPDGTPQYQHLWFDGNSWRHAYISSRTSPFSLRGGGTLQIPISRPVILLDQEDIAYVIFRGDISNDKMAVQMLFPPDYLPATSPIIIWDEPLAYSEPIVDYSRWAQDQTLSMLIQRNYQPDHDENVPELSAPVYVVEWDLDRLAR